MDCSRVIARVRESIALVVTLNRGGEFIGTGSGFIFQKKSLLITCNHVIKDASSIMLKFGDSEYITAKVVIRDDEHDLAIIKFEGGDRKPLPLGNLEKIKEGMEVIFSGYPFSSSDLTTHQGILSAITKDATGITSFLIDGTVNSGNSGCPLMEPSGGVIGIVDASRRVRNDLLQKVEKMYTGALSIQGLDLAEIYQALTSNIQLGIGHSVPALYIPEYKEIVPQATKPKEKKEQ